MALYAAMVRELLEIAKWRLKTRGRHPFHPTHVGFWPLAAKLRLARPPVASNGEFTAVLLVHRRPANIDLQIRAALHAPSVGEVVVSCNNPAVRVRDWTSVESPRLRILEEEGRNQTRRYAVALASGGDRFLLPDDDVLFLPDAVDAFCAALPADGAHPVGLAGQRLLASGLWESSIETDGEEVDVLNRAYVCTRDHAEAVFRNAERLGWSEQELYSNPADDVLVSFAGNKHPVVVHVAHVNCVSHTDARISTYQQGGFHSARADWVGQLRQLHGRGAARRDRSGGGALAPPPSRARSLNVWAQPLRRRYYLGKNVQALSLLPRPLRGAIGLGDATALRRRRLQIGSAPAPLAGFVRTGEGTEPDVTLRGPAWQVDLPSGFADEVVAIGALDGVASGQIAAAVDAWRRAARTGARLLLGVTNDLWQDKRLRDALDAHGFDIVATITDASALEAHPAVSPWKISEPEARLLDPVPAIVDGSADVIVVARAR
ncbi:MAG TPA: glycosyltransferase family A protein [Acidimicrobiales bacterium]|nr:glycosyltransferase family A protein [Acidimicrobiales bacterium]